MIERLKANNARIKNLEDQFADGNIDSSTFNELRSKYSRRIHELEKEKVSRGSSIEQAKLVKSGLNLVENFPSVFKRADVFKKKRLLGSTFPERIQISENKCRTEKINRALLLMLATDKCFTAKKNGQLIKNLKLPGQMEATRQLSNFLEDLVLLCENL